MAMVCRGLISTPAWQNLIAEQAGLRERRREDCSDGLLQETPSAHICPVAFMPNQVKGPDFIQQMHRSGLNGGASTNFVIVVP